MREFLFLLTVLIMGGLALGATPASATDQSGAVKLCAKNPQCGITKGNGGVSLQIEGSKASGQQNAEIFCPDKGECICVQCPRVGPQELSINATVQLGTTRTDVGDAGTSGSGDGASTANPAEPATGHVATSDGWDASDFGQWHASGTPGQIN